jgi:hypothetical protein
VAPSAVPTVAPSAVPTVEPTLAPSAEPSIAPTLFLTFFLEVDAAAGDTCVFLVPPPIGPPLFVGDQVFISGSGFDEVAVVASINGHEVCLEAPLKNAYPAGSSVIVTMSVSTVAPTVAPSAVPTVAPSAVPTVAPSAALRYCVVPRGAEEPVRHARNELNVYRNGRPDFFF